MSVVLVARTEGAEDAPATPEMIAEAVKAMDDAGRRAVLDALRPRRRSELSVHIVPTLHQLHHAVPNMLVDLVERMTYVEQRGLMDWLRGVESSFQREKNRARQPWRM